jgi:hypothetical protein
MTGIYSIGMRKYTRCVTRNAAIAVRLGKKPVFVISVPYGIVAQFGTRYNRDTSHTIQCITGKSARAEAA